MSYSPKAKITNWISFTPTGSWSTNTTYTGRYRRIGDTAEFFIFIGTTGSPGTPGALTIDMPPGLTVDESKLVGDTANGVGASIGTAFITDVGFGNRGGVEACYSFAASKVFFRVLNVSTGVMGDLTHSVPMLWDSNDEMTAHFIIPVQEWA